MTDLPPIAGPDPFREITSRLVDGQGRKLGTTTVERNLVEGVVGGIVFMLLDDGQSVGIGQLRPEDCWVSDMQIADAVTGEPGGELHQTLMFRVLPTHHQMAQPWDGIPQVAFNWLEGVKAHLAEAAARLAAQRSDVQASAEDLMRRREPATTEPPPEFAVLDDAGGANFDAQVVGVDADGNVVELSDEQQAWLRPGPDGQLPQVTDERFDALAAAGVVALRAIDPTVPDTLTTVEGDNAEDAERARIEAFAANPTDDMRTLAADIRAFREMPDCGVGGPLHIVVDDANIEKRSIEWALAPEQLNGGEWTPEVIAAARSIGERLLDLTEDQRDAVVRILAR